MHKLLAPLDRDEQSLMKLDSIFKALAIDAVEDIDKLARFFILPADPAARAVHETRLASLEGVRALSATRLDVDRLDDGGHVLIHANHVARSLRAFLESQWAERNQDTDTVMQQITRAMDAEGGEAAAAKKEEVLRAYWQRISRIIDDGSYRTWQVGGFLLFCLL